MHSLQAAFSFGLNRLTDRKPASYRSNKNGDREGALWAGRRSAASSTVAARSRRRHVTFPALRDDPFVISVPATSAAAE